MNSAPADPGNFLPNDTLAPTLTPLIGSLLGEMLPYLEAMVTVTRPMMDRAGRVRPLPRFMKEVEFPMGSGRYRRPAMPYGLWMLQRLLDDWRAMPPTEAHAVRKWLAQHGAERLLDLQLPRLRRAGLQVALA